MIFKDLLVLLEDAHWDRYATSPGWPWQRWIWDPWVGEFLRTYVPHGTQNQKEGPMTIDEFFVELETCKNDFSWSVDEITGEIRGNDVDGHYCCPLTALARKHGYEHEVDEYREAAGECGFDIHTIFHEGDDDDDDIELLVEAIDRHSVDNNDPAAAIRARLLACLSLKELPDGD